MTFAEALVYAAAHASSPKLYAPMRAYCAVLNLRGEELPIELADQDAGCAAMLAEFRAFDLRGDRDGK